MVGARHFTERYKDWDAAATSLKLLCAAITAIGYISTLFGEETTLPTYVPQRCVGWCGIKRDSCIRSIGLDVNLAWTSFDANARCFAYLHN
jgi:hypothetical protein